MILRYFYDRALAQASYLVGCARTGEALIVDPLRDPAPYLAAAAAEGLRIAQVTETHIHADFVSGARELAAVAGARLFLSAAGTPDWQYAYGTDANITLLHDGDSWNVGNIRVEALHTPGHTPEHLSFLITDTAGADRPMGIFTGDFVFVGDVGRPDLLEEAAGFVGTKETGARQQFASVQRLQALPDYLQLWPGHGAGSACGKALGAVPSTTLGYEKLFNPAFQFTDEAAFVDWLLSGQPEPPRYFAHMKHVNKIGAAPLTTLPAPAHGDAAALHAALAAGDLVIDLRPGAQFTAAHVPGTISIPATSTTYSTYVGWFVDFTRPTYLIVPDTASLPRILTDLRAIGVDTIGAYFLPDDLDAAALRPLPTVTAAAIAHQPDVIIVDVRGATEYAEQHLVGAINVPLGFLPRQLATLPRERPLIVQCASGYRSQIAASLLRRAGFTNVFNLTDPQAVWSAVLPTTVSAAPAPIG